MKSKALIPLLLGGVVGLVAIKFGMDAIQRAQGTPTETVNTVVAQVDIPASYEITSDMLRLVETPMSPLVPEGGFTDVQQLVGRVTSKAIPQDSVVSPMALAPPGTPAGLTERIPEGYRAVSVKIDEVSGVAGQIVPGDFVDVIVVLRVKRGRTQETISRIILQRVKVLAVGRSLGSPSDGGAGLGGTPQSVARSVTLLVADTNVPKLHLAHTRGTLTLAMRGADDRLLAEDTGFATTRDWAAGNEEETQVHTPPPVQTTATERITPPVGKERPPEPILEQCTVTVVNGPLRAPGTTTVQRVTYAGRNSMKVMSVSMGRTGDSPVGSPDSAEGIMRPSRQAKSGKGFDRAAERGRQWSGKFDQPQDREITRE